MAKLTIDGAGNVRVGNRPFGNDAVYRFPVETGATGILQRSRDATAALAVNDVIYAGRLQAGMVPDTMKAIVSNHFGAGVTASFGFAYADGVDSAELPQSATYFGTGIVLSAAAEVPVPIKAKLAALPKDAYLTITVTGAAISKAGYMDVVVRGEQTGAP